MLTSMKNNRSLTFYQPTEVLRPSRASPSYVGGMASVAIANTSFAAAATTNGLNAQIATFRSQITNYNIQVNKFLTILGNERAELSQKLTEKLTQDPSYTGMRSKGVNLAWDYEAADVKMGGNGSVDWTQAQKEEILQNRPEVVNKPQMIDGEKVYPKGGVEGIEGHHINSADKHPELQADPDNIVMLKEERGNKSGVHDHLDAHDGDWRNPTEGDLIDKDKMLKDTNAKRVETKNGEIVQSRKNIFKNELYGLGIAVAIGLGAGVTIGFIVTLAQSGITPESLKLAAIEGGKSGAEAGMLSAVGYGIGRTIGEMATKAFARLIENLGINFTENLLKMVNMGVVGTLTIAVFSAYQFIKLKRQGLATRDALLRIGKQALFSLSLLAVSIAAQGIWGGPAGIIVSVSIGIITISYAVSQSAHQRHFAEKVRVCMIDKCRPSFAD